MGLVEAIAYLQGLLDDPESSLSERKRDELSMVTGRLEKELANMRDHTAQERADS